MQIPAGFILAKVPPAFFLSVAVFCWGIVSMCCGFIKTKEQMIALRFLVRAQRLFVCPDFRLIRFVFISVV
jgi:MFS family permease